MWGNLLEIKFNERNDEKISWGLGEGFYLSLIFLLCHKKGKAPFSIKYANILKPVDVLNWVYRFF